MSYHFKLDGIILHDDIIIRYLLLLESLLHIILFTFNLFTEEKKKLKKKEFIIQQKKKRNTIPKIKKMIVSTAAMTDMKETRTEDTMIAGETEIGIEMTIEEIGGQKEAVREEKEIVKGGKETARGVIETVQGEVITSLGSKMNLGLRGKNTLIIIVSLLQVVINCKL